MYTTAFQEQIDQQSMMSRFYSMRSQTNTKSGADFESMNTLNALSDGYSLGAEKMLYLKANYKRLYGVEPDARVYRYTGQMPGIEEEYARTYNQRFGRYTHQDFQMLGDVLYKGLKGIVGINSDSLPEEQKRRLAAQATSSRMNPGTAPVTNMIPPDVIRPNTFNVQKDTKKPGYTYFHGDVPHRMDRQTFENTKLKDDFDVPLPRKPIALDSQDLMFVAGGIEPSKQVHRFAGTTALSEGDAISSSNSAVASSTGVMLNPTTLTSGNAKKITIKRSSIKPPPIGFKAPPINVSDVPASQSSSSVAASADPLDGGLDMLVE